MSAGNHHIRKVIIEMKAGGDVTAINRLQQNLSRWFEYEVGPELGRQMEAWQPYDQVIEINRVEIDLGQLAPGCLRKNFVESCVTEIVKAAKSKLNKDVASPASTSTREVVKKSLFLKNLDAFESFLKNGVLPWWWEMGKEWTQFEKDILDGIETGQYGDFYLRLYAVLKDDETKLFRLAYQFSSKFLDRIQHCLARDQSVDANTRTKLRHRIEQAITIKNKDPLGVKPSSDSAKPGIKALSGEDGLHAEILSKEKSGDVLETPSSLEEIFIENAGLVVFAPLLSGLFHEVGYLDEDNRFISEHFRIKAVYLLHFLATGSVSAPEPMLSLNKIICGLPITQPIPGKVNLTAKERKAAEHYGGFAMDQWKINGFPIFSTLAYLRSEILLRRGRLLFQSGFWKLQVEEKNQDQFYLPALPWSISMLLFSWMRERITVEWR